MDSLRTTNLTGETNRILAGSYDDPIFGQIKAQPIMQYKPSNINASIPDGAVFDSIVFQMRVDFYCYGATGKTTQNFDIYELTQSLKSEDQHFSNSAVSLSGTPLGSTSIDINYDYYKEEFEDTDADSVINIVVKLDDAFGQRLFGAINPEDINYTDFEIFKENFKGLAIVPQQSDKIIGFNPVDNLHSLIYLYYHNDADTTYINFDFTQHISFSQITGDRSSTVLSGLNQFYTDFDPGPNRYIQSGSSVYTKVDFTKFYDYIDTLSYIIVNSAELEISNVDNSSTYNFPKSLSMSMLKSDNRFKTLKNNQDTTDYLAFEGLLTLGDQSKFYVALDQGKVLPLNYLAETNSYNGIPTLFIQKLFDIKQTRYPYWSIQSLNPQPGKSVDRSVFSKDNVKLKIYYTRTTLTNQ